MGGPLGVSSTSAAGGGDSPTGAASATVRAGSSSVPVNARKTSGSGATATGLGVWLGAAEGGGADSPGGAGDADVGTGGSVGAMIAGVCRRRRLRREAEGRRGGGLADLRLLRRAIEQHDREERAEHGREASAGTGEDHRRASPKGHPGEPAALDPGPNPRAEVAGWRDVTQAAHDPPLFGECGERRAALAAGVEMGIEPLTLGVRQLLGE